MQIINDWVLFEQTMPYELVAPTQIPFRVYGKISSYWDVPVSFKQKPIDFVEEGEIMTTTIVKILYENGNAFFVTNDGYYFVIGKVNKEYNKKYHSAYITLFDKMQEAGLCEHVWTVPETLWDKKFAESVTLSLMWYDGYISFLSESDGKHYYFNLCDAEPAGNEQYYRVYKGFEVSEDLIKKIKLMYSSPNENLLGDVEKLIHENGMKVVTYTKW